MTGTTRSSPTLAIQILNALATSTHGSQPPSGLGTGSITWLKPGTGGFACSGSLSGGVNCSEGFSVNTSVSLGGCPVMVNFSLQSLDRGILNRHEWIADSRRGEHQADDRFCILDFASRDHFQRVFD